MVDCSEYRLMSYWIVFQYVLFYVFIVKNKSANIKFVKSDAVKLKNINVNSFQ